MVLGSGLLKSWSKSQGVVATSSGEAEYYSLTKVAMEALGMKKSKLK